MKELIEDLEDFSDWKRVNENFTFFDYISSVCNFSHIAAISKLLFPDVIIISDCFFIKDNKYYKDVKGFWENATSISNLERIIIFICINSLTNIKSEKTMKM
jgi:hypothetical protein